MTDQYITAIKTEVINLFKQRVTSLQNRVYPTFGDTTRTSDTFVAVDAQITNQERLREGVKNTGLVKVLVVSKSVLELDILTGTIRGVVSINAPNFISFHYSKIQNESAVLDYMEEKSAQKARTFDIKIVWFEE